MVKIWQTPWLLVAAPELHDPHFRRTVLLITEHSAQGSVGFILNRPLDTPLAAAIAPDQASADLAIPLDVPIWEGGPVGRDRGVILSDQSPAGRLRSDESLPISLASSTTALANLAAAADARRGLGAAASGWALYSHRFLTGYAGWGPGQLEDEMRRGGWLQVQATWELVFNCSWRKLWQEAKACDSYGVAAAAPSRSTYLN